MFSDRNQVNKKTILCDSSLPRVQSRPPKLDGTVDVRELYQDPGSRAHLG